MSPETAAFLAAAERAIAHARTIHAVDIPEQAARLAYYAQFHAAQALIFERTGRTAKTHKGVRRLFHKLARNEPRLDPDLPRRLSNAYRDKEIADYESESGRDITTQGAATAISSAAHFVDQIRRLLDPTP